MCPLQKNQPAILFICICRRRVEHCYRIQTRSGGIYHVCDRTGDEQVVVSDWLTSLRMAHTAESLRTDSRSAKTGLKEGSTAPSATPFSKWPACLSTHTHKIMYEVCGLQRGKRGGLCGHLTDAWCSYAVKWWTVFFGSETFNVNIPTISSSSSCCCHLFTQTQILKMHSRIIRMCLCSLNPWMLFV